MVRFFLRLPVITKAHYAHMVGNMGLNSTFCYCNIPVGFNNMFNGFLHKIKI